MRIVISHRLTTHLHGKQLLIGRVDYDEQVVDNKCKLTEYGKFAGKLLIHMNRMSVSRKGNK
jgi:hypothetical protein